MPRYKAIKSGRTCPTLLELAFVECVYNDGSILTLPPHVASTIVKKVSSVAEPRMRETMNKVHNLMEISTLFYPYFSSRWMMDILFKFANDLGIADRQGEDLSCSRTIDKIGRAVKHCLTFEEAAIMKLEIYQSGTGLSPEDRGPIVHAYGEPVESTTSLGSC